MILDEPDEDADNLDDATMLDSIMGDTPHRTPAPQTATDLPEWPVETVKTIDLRIDTETLTWFKSSHPDWRQQMRHVLHAWTFANTIERQPAPPLRLSGPESPRGDNGNDQPPDASAE